MRKLSVILINSILLNSILLLSRINAQNFWQKLNGPYGGQVNDIAICSNLAFAATDNGIFEANLFSGGWSQIALADNNVTKIKILTSAGDKIIAGTNFNDSFNWGTKIYISLDYGFDWKLVNTIWNQSIIDFTADTLGNVFLFYSAQGGGILRSADYGTTWQTVLIIPHYFTCGMSSASGTIFAGVDDGTIYKSSDNGKNWLTVNNNISSNRIMTIAAKNGYVFAGTAEGSVYRTHNEGLSWQNISTGLDGSGILSIISDFDNNLYATTYNGGIFLSRDNGLNWIKVNSISGILHTTQNWEIVFLTNSLGTYQLKDSGSTLTEISIPIREEEFGCLLNYSKHCILSGISNKIVRSTDDGQSWQGVLSLYYPKTLSFAKNFNGDIFAVGGNFAAFEGWIYRSTDNGSSWVYVNFPDNSHSAGTPISYIIFDGQNNIYVAQYRLGVYRSTNNGISFKEINSGLTNKNVLSLFQLNGILFVGTDGGGVYVSTDKGDNWRQSNSGLSSLWITCLASTATGTLFAGSNFDGGVFRSTNNGNTWTSIGPSNESITCLTVNSNNKIFAGTDTSGIFFSTDDGETWKQINSGLTNLHMETLSIDDDGFIFVGTQQGIFKSTNSTLTSVYESKNSLLINFSLQQNYPNPFNPITTIRYSIPAETGYSAEGGQSLQYVTLKVYDLLGREITTLVNEEKSPGNYEVKFDGTNLPSGVYFYRLQAGLFSQTKKFTLIK